MILSLSRAVTRTAIPQFTAIDYTLEADDNAEIYYNAIAQQDGTILLLVNITTHGDMEKPDYDDPDFNDEDFDWEAYYDAAETTYKIVNIDTNGTVISENDLTGLDEYFDRNDLYYNRSFLPFLPLIQQPLNPPA